MNTFLTLFFTGALFSVAHAQNHVTGDTQVGSTPEFVDQVQGYVEQDRVGFRKLIDPPVPPDYILERYGPSLITFSSTPRYRISEKFDKNLIRYRVLNPDVDLFLFIPRDEAETWLSKNLKVNDEQSDLTVLGISWKFPKEYYFYRTPREIKADSLHVRAWNPFRVDAEIKYILNGQEHTKSIEQWVTENDLRQAYQSTAG